MAHNSLSNLHWLWGRDSDRQFEGKRKKQNFVFLIRFPRILFYLLQRTLILIEGLKCHRTFILKMGNKKKEAVPFIVSTEHKECCFQIWVSLVGSHFLSESESHSVVCDPWLPHGLYSPWNSPGQNTGVGSLSLLQGIFPTPGSNPGLPRCRWLLYQLSHQWSPRILKWVAYPFSSRSSWPRNQTGVSSIAGRFFTNCAIREDKIIF